MKPKNKVCEKCPNNSPYIECSVKEIHKKGRFSFIFCEIIRKDYYPYRWTELKTIKIEE